MISKKLGPTTALVPAIGQGTMGIGGRFSPDHTRDAEYVRLLRLGIDLGLNLIDTAAVYGAGHSEKLVGEATRNLRDRAFIATKFSPENSTYEGVIQSAEASLRRLRTDHIDLYQTHWPNPRVPIEETMGAMEQLAQDGKVRYIGLCNFSEAEAVKARSCLSAVPMVALQQEYSLVERTLEQHLLPYCREEDLTLIAYSPLAQGKIATNDGKLADLAEIAADYGISLAQLTLNWLVRDPNVVAIPKAASEKHLRENAAALDCSVDPADHERISQIFEPEISFIPTDMIHIKDDPERRVYKTLDEAIENRLNLVPSPMDLAEEISSGALPKPVKLRLDLSNAQQPRYELTEGRLKYWAWVIAHDGRAPIPALVERRK